MTNPSELVGDVDVCPHCRGTGQPHGIMGGPEHGLCSWCKGTGQKFSSPRNPSETRDSELVAGLGLHDDSEPTLAGLTLIVRDGYLPDDYRSSARAAYDKLREAADTIDRLTSTGEAVAASDVAKPMAARFFKAMTEADDRTSPAEYPDHILVTEYEVMIAMTTAIIDDRVQRQHVSPREGHVEVPVEPTPEMYGAGGVEMFKCDMASVDPRTAVGRIYRAMLAALPHNQGETKP